MAVLSCFWKFFFISYQIGWNALLLVKNWKPMAKIKENSKRHQNWKTTDYWCILKPNVWVPKMTMFTKPQFPTLFRQVTVISGLSAGIGKLCIFGHLGLFVQHGTVFGYFLWLLINNYHSFFSTFVHVSI